MTPVSTVFGRDGEKISEPVIQKAIRDGHEPVFSRYRLFGG